MCFKQQRKIIIAKHRQYNEQDESCHHALHLRAIYFVIVSKPMRILSLVQITLMQGRFGQAAMQSNVKTMKKIESDEMGASSQLSITANLFSHFRLIVCFLISEVVFFLQDTFQLLFT